MKYFKIFLFAVSVFWGILSALTGVASVLFGSEVMLSVNVIMCISAVLTLAATYFFFSIDRSDLNRTTRQFYKDNKVLHNSVYSIILALGVLAAVMYFGFKNITLAFVVYVTMSFIHIVALFIGLYVRKEEKPAYGLILAVAWMSGILVVSFNPILDSYLAGASVNVVKILSVLFYTVFFYVGVRKQ